jgi:hypothetical protein
MREISSLDESLVEIHSGRMLGQLQESLQKHDLVCRESKSSIRGLRYSSLEAAVRIIPGKLEDCCDPKKLCLSILFAAVLFDVWQFRAGAVD